MTHRAFIRKAISHVFHRFVYETERHPGVGELLEILGSIVNGFALPLKQEHVVFLEKSLLPLFRPRTLGSYIQQLCYCVSQYVEKDAAMAVPIIRNMVRFWPVASSQKQIVLLNAVEEIVENAGEGATPAVPELTRLLARCGGSSHFQVAERALFMWQNEKLSKGDGVLSPTHVTTVLPVLYPALITNARGHWNPHVEQLAQFVLKSYQDASPALFEKCEAAAAAAAATAAAAAAAAASTATLPASSGEGVPTAASVGPAAVAAERAARWRRVQALAAESKDGGSLGGEAVVAK